MYTIIGGIDWRCYRLTIKTGEEAKRITEVLNAAGFDTYAYRYTQEIISKGLSIAGAGKAKV